MRKETLFFYILIISASVLARLVPHAWNFAPITAIAIASAIYLPKWQAIGLTVAIRLVSDIIIGFFSWPLMIAVYASHLSGVAIGLWVKKNKTILRIAVSPLASALIFFFVTNFAWFYPEYPHNILGIAQSYINGLPFLRGTLAGDAFYTFAIVGVMEGAIFLKRKHVLKEGSVGIIL
ncbi:MAG: hypothetical protein HYV65_01845 [Candidatus Spechtbacteria bacterium]|nr:hypothetical protein [Candidatus Spechtbacteria bacterium]